MCVSTNDDMDQIHMEIQNCLDIPPSVRNCNHPVMMKLFLQEASWWAYQASDKIAEMFGTRPQEEVEDYVAFPETDSDYPHDVSITTLVVPFCLPYMPTSIGGHPSPLGPSLALGPCCVLPLCYCLALPLNICFALLLGPCWALPLGHCLGLFC